MSPLNTTQQPYESFAGSGIRRMRRMFTLLALTGIPVWFSGCAMLSPTDPYRPVSFSPAINVAGSSRASQAKAESLASRSIGLADAVEIAIANNPELAATGHDAEAARARKDAAFGAMLPALSAEGAYTHHLDDQRLVPARFNGEPGVFSDSIYSGDLVLKMPLFAGGRLINETRAADLLRRSSEHRMVRARDELIFNVTSIFYGILAQEKLIGSLQFSREALDSHLKRVNDLIAAQKAAKVDRLRTEVRLSDVSQKIVREKNTLAIQHRLLANLMGIETTSGTLAVQGELDRATTVSLTVGDGMNIAMKQRPDYLAARKELEAQARRADVARAGHTPAVSLFGAYGGRWAANPSEQPLDTDDSEDVGRVGIGIEMPLFQGGRIQARVKEERAKLAAAQERLLGLELQVRLEVETAFLNLASSMERVQTLEKSVEQAEESLRIEQQKYDLGKGAIVDVLDAQAALLEAQTNYYRALADLNVARAQIELATGERTP